MPVTESPPTPPAPHTPPAPQSATPPRKRMPAWAWAILASVALLIAAIVFVTVVYLLPSPSQQHSTSNPGTTTEQPEKPGDKTEPTTTDQPKVPAAIVLPTCEELIPDAYARAVALVERLPQVDIRFDDVGDQRFAEHFGPAAQTALSQSTQLRGCGYPDSLESYIHVYTSEFTGSPKEAFIAALRADGDFVESTINGAQVFVWTEQLDGEWYAAYTVHAFIGDVWIAGFGNRAADEYVPPAVAAILKANPTLR